MKRLIRCVSVLLMFSAPTAVQAVSGPVDGNSERCPKTVALMGDWPPTNKMLRPWSDNPRHNPATWIGGNWQDRGVDVFAFFPEFPPDGDPSSDWRSDDHSEVMLPTGDSVDAHQLMVATLAAVLDAHPTDSLPCPSSND